MKSKLFLALIFFSSLSNYCLEFNFENFKNKSTEAEKDEMAFCRKFWGKDLCDCMNKMKSSDTKKFKTNLRYLDKNGQRSVYFKEMLKGATNYNELYELHSNDEWKILWESMSENEKITFFKRETGLLASSKDNLMVIIKEKKKEECNAWDTKAALIIVGCGTGYFLIFTPVGPAVVAGLIKLGAAAKGAATVAAVAA